MTKKDELELMELTMEIARSGEVATFQDAYYRARQRRNELRNYADAWNADVSVGAICGKVTIWPTAPTASAA